MAEKRTARPAAKKTTKKSPRVGSGAAKKKTKKSTTKASASRTGRVNIAEYAEEGGRARQRVAGRKPGSTPLTELHDEEPWTAAQVKMLRELVAENTPTRVIGIKIGRTEASIYAKASALGLSLKPSNQSPANRRTTKRTGGRS